MTTRTTLLALASRVEAATASDNALDVLVEMALFKPCAVWSAVRANDAGTKVIYTRSSGREYTCLAGDWTMENARSEAAASLRAIAWSLTDDA